MIKAGSDVNLKETKIGSTPLHIAARKGRNVHIIDRLLSVGSDVAGKRRRSGSRGGSMGGKKGGSVKEVMNGEQEMVDVNAPQRNGWTALHVAAFNGNVAALERLIAAGADVNAGDKDDDAPLHTTNSDLVVEKVG